MRLPSGETIAGSGRNVLYADTIRGLVAAIPVAVPLSLGATVLVVLLAFRALRPTVSVLLALGMGSVCFLGALAALGVRLNVLNFLALPITFGIGVDYAVNVVARHEQRTAPGDRAGIGVLETLAQVGGSVVLCSLTTILGYLALVRSANYAVQSLGIAALLGEICCLLCAVIVLPAVLLLREKRNGDPRRPR